MRWVRCKTIFNSDGFKGYDDGQQMMDRIKALPSAEAVSREEYDQLEALYDAVRVYDSSAESVHVWNNHEIACMLADLFKDPCACNQCCIDEWLPYKCDLDCGNVVGVACWEQFVEHYRERKGGDDE